MEKLDIAVELFANEYGIDESSALNIIVDLDLTDRLYEDYEFEIRERLNDLENEARQNAKEYNDGWSGHEGVK